MSDAAWIQVDRVRAAMRAAWLAALGGPLLLAGILAARGIRWSIMWYHDRATLLATAGLAVLAALAGLWLAVRALRWGLLAAWPRPVGVEIGADRMTLRLGPFGTHGLSLAALSVRTRAPEDDSYVAEDEEPAAPHVLHPAVGGDVLETLSRFTGRSPARLWGELSPRLGESMRGGRME